MGTGNSKSGGEVLSSETQERPYNGPSVNCHFIAGQTRDGMRPAMCEEYRYGRRLLVLKRKPLSDSYVGIFREDACSSGQLLSLSGSNLHLAENGKRRETPANIATPERLSGRETPSRFSSEEKIFHALDKAKRRSCQHRSDDELFRVERYEIGRRYEYSSEDETFYEISEGRRICAHRSDEKLFRTRKTDKRGIFGYDSEGEMSVISKDDVRRHKSEEKLFLKTHIADESKIRPHRSDDSRIDSSLANTVHERRINTRKHQSSSLDDGKSEKHEKDHADRHSRYQKDEIRSHRSDETMVYETKIATSRTHAHWSDDALICKTKTFYAKLEAFSTKAESSKGGDYNKDREKSCMEYFSNGKLKVEDHKQFGSTSSLAKCRPPKQSWKYRAISFWMHGQLLSSPEKQTERAADRKNWVTDLHCLRDTITQHVKPGERLVALCTLTVRAEYSDKFLPKSAESLLPYAVNTVKCPNESRLVFNDKKDRQAIGVELFVEEPTGIPVQPQERFIYRAVPVPATLHHIKRKYHYWDHRAYLGQANVFCDWSATFTHYLSQGFKLVDIFLDIRPPPMTTETDRNSGAALSPSTPSLGTMTQFQFTYAYPDNPDFQRSYITWKPVDIDILWIFEKPQSMEHDETPQYEGKIVPYAMEVSTRDCGIGFDDLIQNMGISGWELATFVERASFWPLTSSFAPKIMMNTLFFFQRPLVADGSSLTGD